VEAIPSKVVVELDFLVEKQEFLTTVEAQTSCAVLLGCANVVDGFEENLRWQVALCGACVLSPASD
jgi:hypothetical protein